MNAINMLGAVQATQIVLWVVLGLMLVALLVYPMITRRRQARDFAQMVDNLSVGDKVMTNIGMIGTIKKINRKMDGATFLLETGEKTVIELDVGAIAKILSSVNPAPVVAKSKVEKKKSDDVKTEQVEEKKEETETETTKTAPKKEPAKKAEAKKPNQAKVKSDK